MVRLEKERSEIVIWRRFVFFKILFHKNNISRKFAVENVLTRERLELSAIFEQELSQSIERPKIANFLPNFTPVIRKALTFVQQKSHF